MAESRPILHHLNDSQSQSVLWLLEELEIPYELKLYERQTSGSNKFRAPDSLKEVHPLGKSPQLTTADGRVIVERSAIIMYLIATYDTAGKFKREGMSGGNDLVRDEMISSFGNSSLNIIVTCMLMFDVLKAMSPFFIRPLFAGLGALVKMGLSKELGGMYKYLDGELEGQEYFMGATPGHADFVLNYPVDFSVQRKYIDLSKYPNMNAWRERYLNRDAWKRALNKGNGYDLNKF